MSNNITLNKRTFFSSLLIVCLLSILFTGAFMLNAQSDITITEESFKETATYSFWIDDATYYAKSGDTGEVTSSSNASYLLDICYSSMTAYKGVVKLSSGAYVFTNNITIPEYGKLIGEGTENTKIYLSGNTVCILSSYVTLKDFTIDGYYQSGSHPLVYATGQSHVTIDTIISQNATTNGIHLNTVVNSLIQNVVSRYHTNFGVYFEGSDYNTMTNSITHNCSYNGIAVAYGSEYNKISDCYSYGNGWHGIHIDEDSNNNEVTNCVSKYNDDGLQVSNSNGNKILNCELSYNNALGLYLNNANYSLVGNIHIISNGQLYPNNAGLFLSTDTVGGAYDNVISSVTVLGAHGSGINETTGDYNVIIGCVSYDATINIYVVGANTRISNCYNGSSYISLNGDLDMNQNEITNGVFHSGSTAPATPVEGQWFYDTDDHTLYVWNSTAWNGILGEGGVSDHGALTGLSDDDHSQYLLVDGTRSMSGDLNMSKNEIKDFVVDSRSTAPSTPTVGQMYYDTDDNILYVWNSTAWHELCEVAGEAPPEPAGALHVDGTQLKDENGTAIRLMGTNTPVNNWMWGSDYVTEEQAGYMDDWGCNSAMILFDDSWKTESTVRTRADNFIGYCSARGIYVTLMYQPTWWGQGSPTHGWDNWDEDDYAEWINLWTDDETYGIALRYADEPYVLFHLYDEAVGGVGGAQNYQTRMRNCIDAIRTVESDESGVEHIIIVSSWCVDTDDWLSFEGLQSYPINRDNVIYDGHLFQLNAISAYDASATGIREHMDGYYWYDMLADDLCVWAGSCGFNDGITNGVLWYTNVLDVLEADGFAGSNGWCWRPDWDMRLLEDWEGTPSEMGEVLQDYLA